MNGQNIMLILFQTPIIDRKTFLTQHNTWYKWEMDGAYLEAGITKFIIRPQHSHSGRIILQYAVVTDEDDVVEEDPGLFLMAIVHCYITHLTNR